MTTRRGFLGMFAVVPFVARAAIKAAAAPHASGGYARGISEVVGEACSDFPMTPSQISTLNLDTTKFRAEMSGIIREAQMLETDPATAAWWRDQEAEDMRHRIAAMHPVSPPERKGDWMQTATGRQFWPLDPRPAEIHIEDIAAALSKLCRYGGHCTRFYSVAEHCVLMARAAPDEFALSALMHDASEAYLSDVIRPIKAHLTNYQRIETDLETAISARFGLPFPTPTEVKRLDNAILADERDQAMVTPPQDWGLTEPPLGVTLQFWAPDKAQFEFLAAFRRYGGI